MNCMKVVRVVFSLGFFISSSLCSMEFSAEDDREIREILELLDKNLSANDSFESQESIFTPISSSSIVTSAVDSAATELNSSSSYYIVSQSSNSESSNSPKTLYNEPATFFVSTPTAIPVVTEHDLSSNYYIFSHGNNSKSKDFGPKMLRDSYPTSRARVCSPLNGPNKNHIVCGLCNLFLNSRQEVVPHIIKKHVDGGRYSKCPFSSCEKKSYTCAKAVKSHLYKMHHLYVTCPIDLCKSQFPNKDLFAEHIDQTHGKISHLVNNGSVMTALICPIHHCNGHYMSKDNYIKHLEDHYFSLKAEVFK